MEWQPAWTVVVSKPRQEDKARRNCAQQGIEVLLPRLRARVGNRVTESFLFPSYLFVMATTATVFGALHSTLGVARTLMMNGQPAKCRGALIEELMSRMDRFGYVTLEQPARISAGQRVRVSEVGHPLFGSSGVCLGMSAGQRVRVLMQMMGRSVSVEVEDGVLSLQAA